MKLRKMKCEKYIEYILASLLFLLLPTSLLNSELYFINNYFTTTILIFVVIVTIVIKLTVNSNISITKTSLLLIIIFITSLISGFLSNELNTISNFNIKYILYLILLGLLRNMISLKPIVLAFLSSIIFTNSLTLLTFLIKLISNESYTNFILMHFGNTGVFCIFLSMSSVVIVSLIANKKINKIKSCLIMSIVILNIILIINYNSRISYIILFSYFIHLFVYITTRLSAKKRIIITSTGAILLFLLLFIFVKKDSSSGRYLILKISKSIFFDYPLFGAGGFSSYSKNYPLYQAEYFSLQNRSEKEIMLADNIVCAINEPLQFACELGIVGLILISILIYTIIKYININKTLRLAFITIIAASFFSYIFHITIFQNIIFFFILLSSIREKKYIEFKNCSFIILVILVIPLIFSTKNIILKYKNSLYLKNKIERGVLFDKVSTEIIHDFKDNQTFIFPYAMELYKKSDFAGCIIILDHLRNILNHSDIESLYAKCYTNLGNHKEAEKHYILASNMCPNRFEYRYELYKLYLDNEKLESAINVAFAIQNLKEKVPTPYTLAIKLEIARFLKESK